MTPPTSQRDRPEGTAMNGAKLRERLSKGEAITMFNPHHVSPGLSARLVELGADSIFVDCEHGAWGFEDVRNAAQVIRGAGGAAIVRPDSRRRQPPASHGRRPSSIRWRSPSTRSAPPARSPARW